MADKHASNTISWQAPQFLYKKKTLLWYTHIAIFFFLICLLFYSIHNYPAVAVVGLVFWYALSKADDHPRKINYEISAHGITLGNRKISYPEIHSFSVDTSNSSPVIVFDLTTPFQMPVTMVAHKGNVEEVVAFLSRHLPQERSLSFIYWLTHKLHY